MKKLLLIILLLIPITIYADSSKVYSIVPNSVLISKSSITIPIEVISLNDGLLSTSLDEYNLGYIENDNIEVSIKDISSKNIKSILVDSKLDSNNYSRVYFKVKNDYEYSKYDKVMTFNIEIIFKDNIPSKWYILGKEVILSDDKDLVNKLNNYNSDDLNYNSICLNKSNKVYYMIIGILIIIIIVLLEKMGFKLISKKK